MGPLVAAIGLLLVGLIISYASARTRKTEGFFFDAGKGQLKRNPRTLWVLVLVGIIYSSLLRYLHTLTGITMLDGSIGVALGLYTCAHPAANAVNLLFFERYRMNQVSSDGPMMRWLALNLLVLLAGWMVIYVGITRLVVNAT
jgi:hypothetical protein